MFQFIESIQIFNKKTKNLHYHQRRLRRTFEKFYPQTDPFDLETALKIPQDLTQELYKCRFLYNSRNFEIEFHLYQKKIFEKILLLEVGDYEYDYKFLDRSFLKEKLNFAREKGFEEVIFLKNGLLTDSSYCNIALEKNGFWFTPKKPLFWGTMRESLLDKNIIQKKAIHSKDLQKFSKIRFFNAMMDWENSIEVSIKQVLEFW